MVNGFYADAVAPCHCFIPVLLRHLRPAIRRQILEMTKSAVEASSRRPEPLGTKQASTVYTEEWQALSSHFG